MALSYAIDNKVEAAFGGEIFWRNGSP